MDISRKLQEEFHLRAQQVDNVIALIDDGNTIPFIARYRKEMTGSLDDQVLRELSERLAYLRGLEKRAQEILASIEAQGQLTEALENAVHAAQTLAELEDLYRPYRPKRRTRASMARERGLEPLAAAILEQREGWDPLSQAAAYVTGPDTEAERAVPTPEDALQGAQDILAEDISDRAGLRKKLRAFVWRTGQLTAKAVDPKTESVYSNYYDFREPVNRIAGHRVLAIDRGEREELLKVTVEIRPEEAKDIVAAELVRGRSAAASLVRAACEDSFDRLIFPSLEREIRAALTERAGEQAIRVFSANLQQLLLQPPVKGSVTLGLDPAYRTGCKIAVVDDTGKVLDTAVVYPTPPQNKVQEAARTLTELIRRHGVTTIAIGNGTASRESEAFVAGLIRDLRAADGTEVSYMLVSEAGASVYSASKLAAEEFPQFDVSLRSAVSIARRLQDPLAELVKIDPKSIGVGQYQHDMPKARLDEALGGVVERCVNEVGVDLNTASYALLSHVAGITPAVARNIVTYREENGAFASRRQLLKVHKLGPKAFEQCAGFLRVAGGEEPLDNTAVHPESYAAAKQLIARCGYALSDARQGKLQDIGERAGKLGLGALCDELSLGEPTVRDILAELARPGRDPRDELPPPLLRSDVLELSDLKRGMELKGTVRNIVDFGAFVDIGVHEDGLVHVSQLSNRYVRHPLEVVHVGDVVTVWVLDVDPKKKRISLTMKGQPQPAGAPERPASRV